jgi:hypothetical protein
VSLDLFQDFLFSLSLPPLIKPIAYNVSGIKEVAAGNFGEGA